MFLLTNRTVLFRGLFDSFIRNCQTLVEDPVLVYREHFVVAENRMVIHG